MTSVESPIDSETNRSGTTFDVTADSKPRVIYVVRREGLSAVFQSQVLFKAAAIGRLAFSVDIVVFSALGQNFRPHLRRRWNALLRSAPPPLKGRVFSIPGFPSSINLPFVEAWVLRGWLRLHIPSTQEPLVLHCRNATVTRMALKASQRFPNRRVIFDCRGVAAHEFLYEHGATFETAAPALQKVAHQMLTSEGIAAAESDAILCVSQAMVDYMVRQHGVSPKKCLVVPCAVEVDRFIAASSQRENIRALLGIKDRFVICYCGSLASYQMPRESIMLFQAILKICPTAHFLGITTQPNALRQVAEEMGVGQSQLTVLSVPHEDVPAYLSAGDIGLLLRESSLVNKVAAPVKFGEYLASGLPVIVSNEIGDYSELVKTMQVGLVVREHAKTQPDLSELQVIVGSVKSSREQWAVRCQGVARACLDMSTLVEKVAAVYHQSAQCHS